MKYIFEVRIRDGYRAEDYAAAWVRASKSPIQPPESLSPALIPGRLESRGMLRFVTAPASCAGSVRRLVALGLVQHPQRSKSSSSASSCAAMSGTSRPNAPPEAPVRTAA